MVGFMVQLGKIQICLKPFQLIDNSNEEYSYLITKVLTPLKKKKPGEDFMRTKLNEHVFFPPKGVP